MKKLLPLQFRKQSKIIPGAVTVVPSGTGAQWGVLNDEAGINVEEHNADVAPEFKEFLFNKVNQKRAFAVAPPEANITIRGETLGSTGLVAATFIATSAVANSYAYGGITVTATSWVPYPDSITVQSRRDGWKNLEIKLSANELIPGV